LIFKFFEIFLSGLLIQTIEETCSNSKGRLYQRMLLNVEKIYVTHVRLVAFLKIYRTFPACPAKYMDYQTKSFILIPTLDQRMNEYP